jgi:hypothetical protein
MSLSPVRKAFARRCRTRGMTIRDIAFQGNNLVQP